MSGKLYIGDTEPLSMGTLDKLYVGDVLVWPATPTDVVYYGAQPVAVLFDPIVYRVTVPAGATKMGVCVAGSGGDGDTTGEGAGGAGGTLVWFNANVVAGQIIEVTWENTVCYVSNVTAAIQYCSINRGGNGVNSTPGSPGTASVVAGAVIDSAISLGGNGGDTTTTGRSGGGGGGGGYSASGTGGAGGLGVVGGTGVAGSFGGSGGGGGTNGAPGGHGGNTHLYGFGSNGIGGTAGQPGQDGSPGASVVLLGGSGGGGRQTARLPHAAFAIRFFAADYPSFVEPIVAPIMVAPQP